jgi:cellulose synthase/poly-beta-1,6-N-acetylglucosamine synthase-like glycosyltransferase
MLLEIIIILIYSIALILIFLYALAQLNLLFNYLNSQKNIEKCPEFDFSKSDEIPFVTIQLPVFNEIYVMERLLKNIVLIDYPKEKLEIQVLDDSNDESLESTAILIKMLQKQGFDIQHILRKNREGFKAGALKEGLVIAKGEYIAIFDADFLPKTDWLKRTIPFFKDEEIGVVQTR